MKKLKRTIFLSCASGVATSAMTIFSYGLSRMLRKNFREPELLADVCREDWPKANQRAQRATGWLLHFLAGVIWAIVYAVPAKRLPKPANTAALGALSGLLAALTWKLTLNRHPRTARQVEPAFFVQLIPAHVLFTMALAICERLRKALDAAGTERD